MFRFIGFTHIFTTFFLVLINAAAYSAVVTGDQLLQQVKQQINNINTQQLIEHIDIHPETVLVDVRTQFEISQLGTIGLFQNINIPRGWLEFRIAEQIPAKDTPIVVYCGQNIRSPMAAKTLIELGYTRVMNYQDGFFAWQEQGQKVNIGTLDTSTLLYQKPKKVIEGVYSAIGAPAPGTYDNSGHNNNLSFVIGDDAVVVFNAGGSYLLAQAMHAEIKKITDKPVKYVVLENAQGHAILGSSYWKENGAEIIAHHLTPEIITRNKDQIIERTQRQLKDKFFNTRIVMPDRTFQDKLELDIKGRKIVLNHFGPAHSPDDIQLILPEEDLMISGDFAFNERMLPILGHTDINAWLENWEKLEALNPKIIIPGHGDVTDMDTVRKFTRDYLTYMRDTVIELIDEGGTLLDAYEIDQSQYRQWKTFRELSRLNAERLFRRLEFE
jgi:glyoxylase-like metal-dependent hydrolase (beta-lactamase superfamily II)/rhodanese-related sulfurtransferase